MTTRQEIAEFKASGSWRGLAELAREMVADAEGKAGRSMGPLMGGGTRIMLAYEHRISDDVDIFLHDVQWIGYLTPRLNDRFESDVKGYEEAASSLKLFLPDGEIDFIIAPSLLSLPAEHADEAPFALEPVEEVLAKKLFYRGWALAPRDLFDWRAVASHLDSCHLGGLLGPLLRGEKAALIAQALEQMRRSSAAAKVWEAIRAANKHDLVECVDWALRELEVYGQCAPRATPRERPGPGA